MFVCSSLSKAFLTSLCDDTVSSGAVSSPEKGAGREKHPICFYFLVFLIFSYIFLAAGLDVLIHGRQARIFRQMFDDIVLLDS